MNYTLSKVTWEHVAPVESQLSYKLTVPLLELGRRVFKDAVMSHPSELPELQYDYSAGWLICWDIDP